MRVFAGRPGCRFHLAATAITDTRHECKLLRFLSHVRVVAGQQGCRFHLAAIAIAETREQTEGCLRGDVLDKVPRELF